MRTCSISNPEDLSRKLVLFLISVAALGHIMFLSALLTAITLQHHYAAVGQLSLAETFQQHVNEIATAWTYFLVGLTVAALVFTVYDWVSRRRHAHRAHTTAGSSQA